MKKSLLFIAALFGAIIAHGQTANISITEGGSTMNRHIPIDSEALSDGIIMGDKADADGGNVESPAQWRSSLGVPSETSVNSALSNKANVDGSNINPITWRSLLDVLTSGQIATLLEDYTPTASLGDAALLDVGTTAGTVAAGTALQPGDDISSLANDAGYITAGDVPGAPVTSVQGRTGAVVLLPGDKPDLELVKADVGLSNVDNTSDANKPISTATQNALDLKADSDDPRFDLAESALQSGDNISELANDAGYITSADIPDVPVLSVQGRTGNVVLIPDDKIELELDNVDNTSDANKPISTATQSALDLKADIDGSNITPSVWRTLLDVLTSGQIEALLEGYVQTVGGVLPDGDGDVSSIPSTAIDMGFAGLAQSLPEVVGLTQSGGLSTGVSQTGSNSTGLSQSGTGSIPFQFTGSDAANIATRGRTALGAAANDDPRFDLAESALQSGDNISELANDSGYLTSATLPPYPDITGKADVDGSNITPSVWRSLLDVLTSGQIDTLLESYVQTVGGVGPDGDGDVTGIPQSAIIIDGDTASSNRVLTVPPWQTQATTLITVHQGSLSGGTIPQRQAGGHIVSPSLNDLINSPDRQRFTSLEYVDTQTANLATAPASDVAEQFVYPRARIPEIGDGDKSWEYLPKIPSADLKMDTTRSAGTLAEGYLWATSHESNLDGSGAIDLKVRYHGVSAAPSYIVQRHVNGVIIGPSVANIESYPYEAANRSALISRQWAAAYVPTLQQTPDQDVAEQFVYPRARIPEIGDGDKSWEYAALGSAALLDVGTTAGTVAAGDDSRFLTANQKAAAAGTSGSPSDTNRYVTDDDTSVAATADSVVRRNADGAIELLDDVSGRPALVQSSDEITGLRQTGWESTGLYQSGAESLALLQTGDYSTGLGQSGDYSTGLSQSGTGSIPFQFTGPDAANIARRGREALRVQLSPVLARSWAGDEYTVTPADVAVPNTVLVISGISIPDTTCLLYFDSGIPVGTTFTLVCNIEADYTVSFPEPIIGQGSSMNVNNFYSDSITITKIANPNTWAKR